MQSSHQPRSPTCYRTGHAGSRSPQARASATPLLPPASSATARQGGLGGRSPRTWWTWRSKSSDLEVEVRGLGGRSPNQYKLDNYIDNCCSRATILFMHNSIWNPNPPGPSPPDRRIHRSHRVCVANIRETAQTAHPPLPSLQPLLHASAHA